MPESIISSDERRLMIAHFVDPMLEGRQFDEWPLHITILPWFYESEVDSIRNIEIAAESMRSCRIALGAKAIKLLGRVEMFGDGLDVPVRRINDSTSLGVIHGMLLGQFHEKLEDKTYIGGNYNPHLTIRENNDPGEASEILVNKISLVEYGRPAKTVIKNFELIDETTT